jgi:hypothetical protein
VSVDQKLFLFAEALITGDNTDISSPELLMKADYVIQVTTKEY